MAEIHRCDHLMILQEAQKLILKHGYEKVTMTDIAKACRISRTTLYKSYPSKESVIVGLIEESLAICVDNTEALLESTCPLKSKLEKFFDIWTIQPAASVIDLDAGRDILVNVSNYAPEAVDKHYAVFESLLADVIRDGAAKKIVDLPPEDLAHIITLSSRGLKASAKNLNDLQRMINGLITIIIAAVG